MESGSEKKNTMESINQSEKDLHRNLNFKKDEKVSKALKAPPMLYEDDDEAGIKETQESLAEIHQEQAQVQFLK